MKNLLWEQNDSAVASLDKHLSHPSVPRRVLAVVADLSLLKIPK